MDLKNNKKRGHGMWIWLLGTVLCAVTAVLLNRIYCSKQINAAAGLDAERICLFFLLGLFAFSHYAVPLDTLYGFLYRYRYPIAGMLFVGGVALTFHGSSMSMWNQYCDTGAAPSVYQYPILGVERSIRSDEWDVFTPLAMSQWYNQYGVENAIACAWPTNMLTVYNQPVWDITAIAKPFYWGYLLFGSEIGLSWFWVGRLLALFLVTFEMGMVLTQGNKLYSLMLTVLITFSSVVQWWFAINFFVEMLVYGQLALLMLHRFLNAQRRRDKVICTMVITLCALGYVFSLYPAWMIPVFYLILILAIWILAENIRGSRRCVGELVYPLSAVTVIVLICGIWLWNSADAIAATMNTVYPGKRVYTGGVGGERLLYYLTNLFLPVSKTFNPCEAAMAYGFFPFTEVLVLIYLVRTRGKDKLLTMLMGLDLFFLYVVSFSIPEPLAKITLLHLSSERMVPIICLIEILMYVRILAATDEPVMGRTVSCLALWVLLSVLGGILTQWTVKGMSWEVAPEGITRIPQRLFITAMISGFCGMFCIPRSEKIKKFCTAAAVLLSLATGALVNPVMRTTDAIYDKPLSQAVQQIQQEEPGTWISTDSCVSNFLISNGAPTVNSCNIIPAAERWKQIDPNGVFEEVYNRYAHIMVCFGEETKFELLSPDLFQVQLSFQDLQTLGVRYICTPVGYAFAENKVEAALTKIYTDEKLQIHELRQDIEAEQ